MPVHIRTMSNQFQVPDDEIGHAQHRTVSSRCSATLLLFVIHAITLIGENKGRCNNTDYGMAWQRISSDDEKEIIITKWK